MGRILLRSTTVLAIGLMLIGPTFDPLAGQNLSRRWPDPVPDVSRLYEATERLLRALERTHGNGAFHRSVENLNRIAGRLAHGRRYGTDRRDNNRPMSRLQRAFLAARADFHHRFEPGPDRRRHWYANVLRAWLDVVDNYHRIAERVVELPPVNFPGPRIHTTTVRCRSRNYQWSECRLPGTIVSVRLRDRKSRARCIEGESFGFRGNTLWVRNGCDAEFDVSYRDPIP